MDTVTTGVSTSGQVGRRALRLVVGGMLALLVLGATMDAAGARQQGRGLPQSTFMKNCRDSGGTVGSGAGDNAGSAWCTWRNPDGSVTEVACEFTGSYLWYCTGSTRLTAGPGSPTHGGTGGSVVLDVEEVERTPGAAGQPRHEPGDRRRQGC